MKKLVTISLAIILFSTAGMSQFIRFGIAPGLALSHGKYEPEGTLDTRFYAGFDGGVLLELGGKRFMIQPEANYTMIGVELNNNGAEHTYKLRYITVPVLAKFSCNRVNFLAGPQWGFMRGGRDEIPQGPVTEVEHLFKDRDFSWVAGLDYKFSRNVYAGLRYNHGTKNVAKEESGFELRNRWASLRIGFMLGKK